MNVQKSTKMEVPYLIFKIFILMPSFDIKGFQPLL